MPISRHLLLLLLHAPPRRRRSISPPCLRRDRHPGTYLNPPLPFPGYKDSFFFSLDLLAPLSTRPNSPAFRGGGGLVGANSLRLIFPIPIPIRWMQRRWCFAAAPWFRARQSTVFIDKIFSERDAIPAAAAVDGAWPGTLGLKEVTKVLRPKYFLLLLHHPFAPTWNFIRRTRKRNTFLFVWEQENSCGCFWRAACRRSFGVCTLKPRPTEKAFRGWRCHHCIGQEWGQDGPKWCGW